MLGLDNTQDRPLRRTTGWTRAAIVPDVAGDATELHFGALLDGAGALDLTQPRFGEVDMSVPVTAGLQMATPLSEEPQALDFGVT